MRDHLAGIGLEGECGGCTDSGFWTGDSEELDDVRQAAGLTARSRLEHALQWGRHDGWRLLSEDEELVLVDEFDFDLLRLVRVDPACVKTRQIDRLLRKLNPTCGTKGCPDHPNGPVRPVDEASIVEWAGTSSPCELDDDTLVLFTIGSQGEVSWTRVDQHVLWVVWLDQDEAVAHRTSREHKLFSRPLGLARRELWDQGDGLLVVRGQHGQLSLRTS
jgi:hypothetical protein